MEPGYWPISAAGFLAEAGLGLLLTVLMIRTRFWIYSAAWVNRAFISSGSDFIKLAIQLGVSQDYYLLIIRSLFLTGFLLFIPWYLLAVRQSRWRIPEPVKS